MKTFSVTINDAKVIKDIVEVYAGNSLVLMTAKGVSHEVIPVGDYVAEEVISLMVSGKVPNVQAVKVYETQLLFGYKEEDVFTQVVYPTEILVHSEDSIRDEGNVVLVISEDYERMTTNEYISFMEEAPNNLMDVREFLIDDVEEF